MVLLLILALLLLLLLLRLAVVAAMPPGVAERGALAPSDMPLRVHQAIRRKAQGINIRAVRVEMDGPSAVRYTVAGSMPDGSGMTLVVHGDGQVTSPEETPSPPAGELPPVVHERLSQCLPSFHAWPGRVRLVKGDHSAWYELGGELAGGVAVHVKISLDGHDLLLTVSGRHS